MRCFGRKIQKDKWERCKNNAPKYSCVCKKHRLQFFLFLFITIPSVVGIYGGVFRDVLEPIMKPVKETKEEEIKKLFEQYGHFIDNSDLPDERFIAKKYENYFDKDYYRSFTWFCDTCFTGNYFITPVRNIKFNGQGFYILEKTKKLQLAVYLNNLFNNKGIKTFIGHGEEFDVPHVDSIKTFYIIANDPSGFFDLCLRCDEITHFSIDIDPVLGIRQISTIVNSREDDNKNRLDLNKITTEVTLGNFKEIQRSSKVYSYYQLTSIKRIGVRLPEHLTLGLPDNLQWIDTTITLLYKDPLRNISKDDLQVVKDKK